MLCTFENSTWLKKGDSTSSKNWYYNSKHNMVKKTKFYLQLNIFLNPPWLKYKILPSVKIAAFSKFNMIKKKYSTSSKKKVLYFKTPHSLKNETIPSVKLVLYFETQHGK